MKQEMTLILALPLTIGIPPHWRLQVQGYAQASDLWSTLKPIPHIEQQAKGSAHSSSQCKATLQLSQASLTTEGQGGCDAAQLNCVGILSSSITQGKNTRLAWNRKGYIWGCPCSLLFLPLPSIVLRHLRQFCNRLIYTSMAHTWLCFKLHHLSQEF